MLASHSPVAVSFPLTHVVPILFSPSLTRLPPPSPDKREQRDEAAVEKRGAADLADVDAAVKTAVADEKVAAANLQEHERAERAKFAAAANSAADALAAVGTKAENDAKQSHNKLAGVYSASFAALQALIAEKKAIIQTDLNNLETAFKA